MQRSPVMLIGREREGQRERGTEREGQRERDRERCTVAAQPSHVDREVADRADSSRAVVARRFPAQELPLRQCTGATVSGGDREHHRCLQTLARPTLAAGLHYLH